MEVVMFDEQGPVPVTVMHVRGSITTNEELEAQARAAYEAGTRNILLDLTEVPYMASAGLRALHYMFTLLRTDAPDERPEAVKRGLADGTFVSPHLKLLKPSKAVREVLRATGYDMFLEIHDDRKRALQSFRHSSAEPARGQT